MKRQNSSKCRLRKVQCPGCGNTARQTRSWMLERGLLGCSCGGKLEPTELSDRAYIGMIGPEDVSQAVWNQIARENGWTIMLNHGQHVQAERRGTVENVIAAPAKPQCAYPGCGRWTAGGAEHCSQHAHEIEPAMPF